MLDLKSSDTTDHRWNLSRRVSFFEELRALTFFERTLLIALMVALFIFSVLDIGNDVRTDASVVHIVADAIFGCSSLVAVILIWARFGRKHIDISKQLKQAKNETEEASVLTAHWKSKAEQLKEGIAKEIDQHMSEWKLSTAEKEVGLLLLKGLSIKEISAVRGTSEGTVRHQSLSIYSKSGVTGRSELSAFFMEDLLDRKAEENIIKIRSLNLN